MACPDSEIAYPRHYHEIIVDGRRCYALDAHQEEYVLHPLHAKGFTVEPSAAGIFSDFTFGDLLFSNDRKKAVASLMGGRLVGNQVLDGTICDKVQFSANIEMPDGVQKTTYVYWIGRKDGLLRRLESKSSSMNITESYSIHNVGKAIPKKEFLIKPPAKARRIAKFE